MLCKAPLIVGVGASTTRKAPLIVEASRAQPEIRLVGAPIGRPNPSTACAVPLPLTREAYAHRKHGCNFVGVGASTTRKAPLIVEASRAQPEIYLVGATLVVARPSFVTRLRRAPPSPGGRLPYLPQALSLPLGEGVGVADG